MKTIFIITTRNYPYEGNKQFSSVINEYIHPVDWDSHFRSFWKTDSSKYPIKKGDICGVTFYVAPCMHEKQDINAYNYLKSLIDTIKNDIQDVEYQLFLIAHDRDFSGSQEVFAAAINDSSSSSRSRNILKQLNGNNTNEVSKVCGVFSYKHEQNCNLKVVRGLQCINLQEEDKDIYTSFIQYLSNKIGKNELIKLKEILSQLQINIDFDVIEQEEEQNNSNVGYADSYYSYDYGCTLTEMSDEQIEKQKQELKDYYRSFTHTDKPILIKTPHSIDGLDIFVGRLKFFLDSSIWFYTYNNNEELEWIKKQIQTNKERYQLQKAREYREFYTRMLMEDYFDPSFASHSGYVVPFLFHSEKQIKNDIDKSYDIINKLTQYRWRILLVDDHSKSEDKMDTVDGAVKCLTKLDVVKFEIKKLFSTVTVATEVDDKKIKENANIYIEYASSLGEARTKLEHKKYEIVLLDYLLGKKVIDGKTVTINNKEVREYGYELLKGIWYKENEKKFEKARKEELEKLYKEFVFDYKKGPDNRFYFMFISAFTTAVSERLLTEGWHRSEDYWYIGEGACPINTPYLFQYRLLHIMEKRMKDMGLSKILGINSNDFEKSYIKEKIIDVIYDDRTSIRQNANNRFNEVLSVLYNYKNLLVDTHNASNPFDSPESTLATDIVMKNAYIGGFLEHLTQLVYLTAFGTVRQWPEMWEEYQFLKSVVGKRIESIEKYIFNLKNNSVD